MSASPIELVRLLQLASPALPIGAYSYSQGLEWMIETRVVRDAATAQQWIGDMLELVMAQGEAAVVWRMLRAVAADDMQDLATWNAWHRASRETRELRAETEQMGASLLRLAADLELIDRSAQARFDRLAPVTLPAAFAIMARALEVPARDALIGYLASWLESQVLVVVKGIPLGQVAGQRLLHALGTGIPPAAQCAMTIDDDDVASFAPGLALASARHEMQYSRLFRS